MYQKGERDEKKAKKTILVCDSLCDGSYDRADIYAVGHIIG